MYDDTMIGVSFTNEQSFEHLFVEELELLCKLKRSHFIFHDPLDHSVFYTSHSIPLHTLDIYDSWDTCFENLFKLIINTCM